MIQLKNGNKTEVISTIRNHVWASDVTADTGGEDRGPNPHELLESALAACTSITIQMYARRKQMTLTDVRIECTTVSESKTDSVISRKIELIGDLTADERKRLLEIADKCPIHKLLTSQIQIQTESVV